MIKTTTTLLLCAAAIVACAEAGITTMLRGLTPQRRLEAAAYMAVMSPPSILCFIENGFDYLGEDITNVPGATPESCCSKCATTVYCNAYSWTDYNGGTCWLKKSRGQIVVNPKVKSALFFYGERPVCAVNNDVDLVGNDVGNAPSATAEPCCEKCRAFAGCRAYSWSNHNGGTCWFKSKRGDAISKSGVKSADVYPIAGVEPVCAQEANTDYEGFDIANQPSASSSGCCSICKGRAMCRVWTWTSHNGGTCWLKSLKGQAVTKSGAVSAKVYDNPSVCPWFEEGVDYVGNDIGNVASKDPGLCCAACIDLPGCQAFSWNDFNGGTCWLKSAKGTTVSKPGVKSFAVVLP